MQTKQIRFDGTEYVWQEKKWLKARKVKAISTGTMEKWAPRRGSRSVPGIRVELLDEGPWRKHGERFVVPARQIISTWADFEADQASAARAASRTADAIHDENVARAEVQAILRDANIAEPPLHPRWGDDPAHYTLTVRELLALLEAVK